MVPHVQLWAIMLATAACTSQTAAQPAAAPAKCAVVGSIPYWAQAQAVAAFRAHREHVDHLSLFWYHLGPDGAVLPYKRARVQGELVKTARAQGVKVFGLVANLPDDEREGPGLTWDPRRVHKAIHADRRADHVEELRALARRMRFDGILIDYEALPRSQRADFSAFIEALAAALHADGRLLAVAIHPKTSENDPRETNGSEAQDWDVLARHADQLHFMTYSQHTGSTPGPVASLAWVERVLRYAVEQRKLPRSKIFVGLPLYAEQWSEPAPGTFRALDVDLTFADVQRRRLEHGGTELWSEEHQSPYLTYRDGGGTPHIAWFENARSSNAKLALAASLGLCNVALWRLGGEDPAFWQGLRALRTRPAPPPPPGVKRAAARQPTAKRRSSGGVKRRAPAPKEEAEEAAADDDAGDDDAGARDVAGYEVDAVSGVDAATDIAATDAPADSTDAAGAAGAEPLEVKSGIEVRGLRLSGSLSAEAEYYNKFGFEQPEHERSNVLSSIGFEQTIAFTDRLALHQDVRVVLESDGEDRRYYSDFPHRGIYLRSLLLQYARGPVTVFGGRYEPAEHLTSRKVIFFGNYSPNLELYGQLGGGAALTYEHERAGRHTLTGHVFRRDTSRLRGEIISDQARDYDYYGEVGEYGPPDSYLVTVDGERSWRDVPHGYAVGVGKQTRGRYRDQHVVFGNVFGGRPLRGQHVLELSLDAMYLHNATGAAEDRTILGAGLGYVHPRGSIGAAYSVRFVEPTDVMTVETGRTDHIFELVARVPITKAWLTEAAYQRSAEWHATENALGIVFKYSVDWGTD